MFEAFPKMGRLFRDIIITEKLDGTNAQVIIDDVTIADDAVADKVIAVIDGLGIWAGSRTRLITPKEDNFGFARWVQNNAEELVALGIGRHFGEWWGSGIQRGYGLDHKKFSLFNTTRWSETRPACCDVVPELYRGSFSEAAITTTLTKLHSNGSVAAPGFMKPEGIITFHTAANVGFKTTLDGDGHKGA